MTRHPLTDVRLKLKRADKHFDTLDREFRGFITTDTYPLESRVDEETGWKTVHVRIAKEPPDEWAVIVGEAMFQLRSALDILVRRLSVSAGGSRTQFPIFTDATDYRQKRGRNPSWRNSMLKGVPEKHRAIVDSYQPYHRVKPDRDPLAILRAVTDADKHNEVQAVVMQVKRPNVKLSSVEGYPIGDAQLRFPPLRSPLTDDAEILGVKLWPDPYAKVKMEIQANFTIGFEPASASMDDLDRVRGQVKRIVRRFEPAFP